jgi:outer membrane immunogenic protein
MWHPGDARKARSGLGFFNNNRSENRREFVMKRFFLASAGLAALATSSFAADLPRRMEPARAPVVLPFTWTGFYAGVNIGGVFASNNGNGSGVIGGGQIGYNWQTANLVFGIETDIQGSSQSGSSTFVSGGTTFADSQKLTWFGTTRGRVGVAMDRWLPYVTAGVAYGTREFSGTATGTLTGPYSASYTAVGYALGAGVDYSFNQSWSGRLEYLFTSLEGPTNTYALTGGTATVAYGRLDNHVIRGAVNYRFAP